MAEIAETDGFTTEPANRMAETTAGRRVFPFVVVAAAVFPMALGIGLTLQAVAPPPARLAASVVPAHPVPNHIPPQPRPDSQDRSHGDDLLRDARYEAALHLYRALGSDDSRRAAPELTLRMGFCQEGLGQWDDALVSYRAVAQTHDARLASAAVLGQSRVWLRLNEFATAEPLLRSLLLRSGDPRIVPAGSIAEITLLYSLTLTEQTLLKSAPRPTAGLTPVGNRIEWSLTDALNWADEKPSAAIPADVDTPMLEVSIPELAGLAEDTPSIDDTPSAEDPSSADDATESLDAIPEDLSTRRLQVVAKRKSIADVLTRISSECRLQLDWSPSIRERTEARVIDVNIRDFPLAIVLTAVCLELDLHWKLQPLTRTVTILEPDSAAERVRDERDIGRALLSGSIELFPDHRLTKTARFAIAQLAAVEDRFDDAAALYSSLVGPTTSPMTIRAAFNAGLAYYQARDRRRACQSLEVVVHGAPGNALHTAATMVYGRTLMELGEYREAAFQLKRAAGSRHGSDEQARAAVFLAMAQLLDGRPYDAADSLFAHRLQFHDRSVRNAAALMTSLARWRTTSGNSKDRESAFLYRSVVAMESQSDWLGPAGQLLLGQAMHEVDLDDSMVDLYTRALEQGVPTDFESQMKLSLADYWYAHDRAADAKVIWSTLYATDNRHSLLAGLRLAAVELNENRPVTCLELCRALQNREGVDRPHLLRLAGQAYELADRPILAARCYAGHWPVP
jgi:tetratricopeptide (TPR) repeat protein